MAEATRQEPRDENQKQRQKAKASERASGAGSTVERAFRSRGRASLRPPSVRSGLEAPATKDRKMIIVLKSGATDVEVEDEGLKLLAEAKRETGLPIVTEVMEPDKVELVAEYADILQVGARNVQNFSLLRRVGEAGKPVLLKRGMATTIQEWLLSAEYVLASGNRNVILCERGIRTFEASTRYTLNLNAVPVVKKLSHLPIFVDPSHGTGHWEFVEAMALAGVAAGADGLIIEVHPKPEEALSDGPQSLKPERFARLMQRARRVAGAMDRDL